MARIKDTMKVISDTRGKIDKNYDMFASNIIHISNAKVFQICLTPLSRMIKAIISRTFSLMIRHSRRSRTAARLSEIQLISRMGQNFLWLNL